MKILKSVSLIALVASACASSAFASLETYKVPETSTTLGLFGITIVGLLALRRRNVR